MCTCCSYLFHSPYYSLPDPPLISCSTSTICFYGTACNSAPALKSEKILKINLAKWNVSWVNIFSSLRFRGITNSTYVEFVAILIMEYSSFDYGNIWLWNIVDLACPLGIRNPFSLKISIILEWGCCCFDYSVTLTANMKCHMSRHFWEAIGRMASL